MVVEECVLIAGMLITLPSSIDIKSLD